MGTIEFLWLLTIDVTVAACPYGHLVMKLSFSFSVQVVHPPTPAVIELRTDYGYKNCKLSIMEEKVTEKSTNKI